MKNILPFSYHIFFFLTLLSLFLTLFNSFRRSLSCRNQPIDLQSKSMDWCLYERPSVTKELHGLNLPFGTAWIVSEFEVFTGPNTEKHGPDKTSNSDTFYTMRDEWLNLLILGVNIIKKANFSLPTFQSINNKRKASKKHSRDSLGIAKLVWFVLPNKFVLAFLPADSYFKRGWKKLVELKSIPRTSNRELKLLWYV